MWARFDKRGAIPDVAYARDPKPHPGSTESQPSPILDRPIKSGDDGFLLGASLRSPGLRDRNLHPSVILSISARSSALSCQPIALTFCSICSSRVAPAITLETCGRDASQENASSSMLWPRAFTK